MHLAHVIWIFCQSQSVDNDGVELFMVWFLISCHVFKVTDGFAYQNELMCWTLQLFQRKYIQTIDLASLLCLKSWIDSYRRQKKKKTVGLMFRRLRGFKLVVKSF